MPGHPTARVFTFAPGTPFLPAIARAVLDGTLPPGRGADDSHGKGAGSAADGDDPLALCSLTILVPTRRAARALQEAFLIAAGGRGVLLPDIRPIADADEDRGLIETAARVRMTAADAMLPPAIDARTRQLLLARLIQAWAGASELEHVTRLGDAAQALRLAQDLARLVDEVETEGVSLDALHDLVPDDLSRHWQTTLDLIAVLQNAWPAALDERGLLSPADRRNRIIRAEAERLHDGRHTDGVIVAGVTGSVPATAELMRAVADHPRGAIVLPNLDLGLDAASYDSVRPQRGARSAAQAPDNHPGHPEHPQFELAGVLTDLGVTRDAVAVLGARCDVSEVRARIISEAMRPAPSTMLWHGLADRIDTDAAARALDGVSLIAAPTPADEAEIVALILRQALETDGQTAALVSPDRLLARRVVARMKTWGIEVDDSAGRPFRKTPPGVLFDLILEVVAGDARPGDIVALLKHPLCRLGLAPGDVRRRARNLELAAFRRIYLGAGIDGIRQALAAVRSERDDDRRLPAPVMRMDEAAFHAVDDLVERLDHAFEPFAEISKADTTPAFQHLVGALVDTAERIAALPPPDDTPDPEATAADTRAEAATESPLWAGEAGEVAAELMAQLIDPELPAPEVTRRSFADAFRALIANETVRPRSPVHPRLSIWGPFEARLQTPDVIVLGSLNEGTWPEAQDTGPWLNRPMRRDLGLPQPETAIGRAAHDVAALMEARTVYLTRAEKADGTPTVPSRWLLRLNAVLESLGQAGALAPREPWTGWAAARQAIAAPMFLVPPEPRPPANLRPKRLSVSDVETWIANPYALFARRILRLEPLPALDASPDALLRGTVVHGALHAFARAHPTTLPDDIAGELNRALRDALAAHAAHPTVAAFWMPRFARFADWFAETEPARRQDVTQTVSEVAGAMSVLADDAALTLTARADRIDITPEGLRIYDYKTSANLKPMAKGASKLQRPQLPLEAAIARDGGYPGLPRAITDLAYISASGGDRPGDVAPVTFDGFDTIDAAIDQAVADLARLVALYADPSTPYRAVRRAGFTYDFDDYEQLARVAEWQGRVTLGAAEAGDGP